MDTPNGRIPGPITDPSTVYPEVPGLSNSYLKFRLGSEALTDEERKNALAEVHAYHTKQKSTLLGYQTNQAMNYSEAFTRYLDMHVNNVGDPFTSGNFTMNSKWMERAVLDYYASLWNARWPHDDTNRESYWGFVLSMGSTEGNMYGMWNARDYLGGKVLLNASIEESNITPGSKRTKTSLLPRLMHHQAFLPKENCNAYTPIAFYSQDTHYSITKAMTMLAIRTFYDVGRELYVSECPLGTDWPKEVPSKGGYSGTGSIDIDALAKLVEFFAARGYPIMVCFNYGTTFKGAYDDVQEAGKKLVPIFEKYGLLERKVYYDLENPELYDVRTGFWFHVDGALGAAYMPFIEMAYEATLLDQRGPNFDFRLPFVHSIAMSGHKWIGIPIPCGVYMTKTKYQLLPPDIPAYIGTADTTFAGSRNGLSTMLLWDYLSRQSFKSQVSKACVGEEMAKYMECRLLELQNTLKMDLWVLRTPLSLSVRFRQPNPSIVFKYSLSSEMLEVDDKLRKYCHVFMMEHVTTPLVDEFISELSQEGAFALDSNISHRDFNVIRATTPFANRRASLQRVHYTMTIAKENQDIQQGETILRSTPRGIYQKPKGEQKNRKPSDLKRRTKSRREPKNQSKRYKKMDSLERSSRNQYTNTQMKGPVPDPGNISGHQTPAALGMLQTQSKSKPKAHQQVAESPPKKTIAQGNVAQGSSKKTERPLFKDMPQLLPHGRQSKYTNKKVAKAKKDPKIAMLDMGWTPSNGSEGDGQKSTPQHCQTWKRRGGETHNWMAQPIEITPTKGPSQLKIQA